MIWDRSQCILQPKWIGPRSRMVLSCHVYDTAPLEFVPVVTALFIQYCAVYCHRHCCFLCNKILKNLNTCTVAKVEVFEHLDKAGLEEHPIKTCVTSLCTIPVLCDANLCQGNKSSYNSLSQMLNLASQSARFDSTRLKLPVIVLWLSMFQF